jgi:hypothetical protein
MDTAVRIGAGVLMAGHGLAHAVASAAALGATQEDLAAPPWMPRWARIAGFPLFLVAAAGLIAGAVGAFADASWFRAPALAGAGASTVVLWTWFAGLPVGGKLGALFDIPLVVWLVVWE